MFYLRHGAIDEVLRLLLIIELTTDLGKSCHEVKYLTLIRLCFLKVVFPGGGSIWRPKNWWKLMKIANTDREILHIFWTTWGISMKFSGKMCLLIILKVTKIQGFTLSLENTSFEKPQEGGDQIDPPPPSPTQPF